MLQLDTSTQIIHCQEAQIVKTSTQYIPMSGQHREPEELGMKILKIPSPPLPLPWTMSNFLNQEPANTNRTRNIIHIQTCSL